MYACMQGRRGDVLHSPPYILGAHDTLFLIFETFNVMYGEHLPCVLDLCFILGRDLVLLREFAPARSGGLFAAWGRWLAASRRLGKFHVNDSTFKYAGCSVARLAYHYSLEV